MSGPSITEEVKGLREDLRRTVAALLVAEQGQPSGRHAPRSPREAVAALREDVAALLAEAEATLAEAKPALLTAATPGPASPTAPSLKLRPRWTRHRDAGRFSYMVGLTGTILFMATGLGPGWLGFVVAYLPASMLAAWVTASHA
jgi:hypothetical protein